MRFNYREKPFGLIIVLDKHGNANGDVFYDDGESIDTIETKSYFYATYNWSAQNRQLKMNIIQNNYNHMSNLILDSFTIYGFNKAIGNISVNNKQVPMTIRPNTEIVDVNGLGLSMTDICTMTWTSQGRTKSSNTQWTIACNKTFPPNGVSSILYSKYVFYWIFIVYLIN